MGWVQQRAWFFHAQLDFNVMIPGTLSVFALLPLVLPGRRLSVSPTVGKAAFQQKADEALRKVE